MKLIYRIVIRISLLLILVLGVWAVFFYMAMMDEVNDARLLTIATERMVHYDPATVISEAEMNRRMGITAEDLADFDEVDIE